MTGIEMLIWYLMPGSFIIITVHLLFPTNFHINSQILPLVLAAIIPIVGFVWHQIFRLFFEVKRIRARFFFGPLMDNIIAHYKENGSLNHVQAFDVWLMTFYSNLIPEAYRIHDQKTWHYIISFFSTGVVCACCGVTGVIFLIFSNRIIAGGPSSIIFAGFVLIAIIFFWRGYHALTILRKEEKLAFSIYKNEFDPAFEAVLQDES